MAIPNRKQNFPVFTIAHDDDDDDDDDHSSSLDEHLPTTSPPPPSPRPLLSRGASAPILLSNGKPLKSSLKSSPSSPTMSIPPHTQQIHLRARSEPHPPKNVHFPEKDYALATVCVYNRSARPAALSNPANGNGDETETDGEDTPPTRSPFPSRVSIFACEIDPTKSSPVPRPCCPPANVLLESLHLSSPSSTGPATKPLLTGSILVRNLAFEKHVAIRFTLDDWQTVSEVGARYVNSLSLVLPTIVEDTASQRAIGWDRFTFAIRLEDYLHSLSTRTLWLVARYRTNSTYPEPGSSQYGPGGEWWDNNGGENYRVGFRPAMPATTSSRSRPRRETVSAPLSFPPMACKEYALGLMVPSAPREDRRTMPQHFRRLNLCNYAPPTVRATSSISFPSAGSPLASSPSTLPSSSDEDSASPASSTLSTPSVSPTIIPRVILNGQPAASSDEDDNAIKSDRPGHTVNWDWTSPYKPRIEELSRHHVDPVPGSESTEQQCDVSFPPEIKTLRDNASLYNAFVTKWCFSQGPSPSHHTYDDGGIMA